MKRSVFAIALASAITMGTAMAEETAAEIEISGELIRIDGATYLIKDMNGVEHALHVDDTTKKEGGITVGAQVEAYVSGTHVTKLTTDE